MLLARSDLSHPSWDRHRREQYPHYVDQLHQVLVVRRPSLPERHVRDGLNIVAIEWIVRLRTSTKLSLQLGDQFDPRTVLSLVFLCLQSPEKVEILRPARWILVRRLSIFPSSGLRLET